MLFTSSAVRCCAGVCAVRGIVFAVEKFTRPVEIFLRICPITAVVPQGSSALFNGRLLSNKFVLKTVGGTVFPLLFHTFRNTYRKSYEQRCVVRIRTNAPSFNTYFKSFQHTFQHLSKSPGNLRGTVLFQRGNLFSKRLPRNPSKRYGGFSSRGTFLKKGSPCTPPKTFELLK